MTNDILQWAAIFALIALNVVRWPVSTDGVNTELDRFKERLASGLDLDGLSMGIDGGGLVVWLSDDCSTCELVREELRLYSKLTSIDFCLTVEVTESNLEVSDWVGDSAMPVGRSWQAGSEPSSLTPPGFLPALVEIEPDGSIGETLVGSEIVGFLRTGT